MRRNVSPECVGNQVSSRDDDAAANDITPMVVQTTAAIRQQPHPPGLSRRITAVFMGFVVAVLGLLILVAIQQSKIADKLAKNSEAQIESADAASERIAYLESMVEALVQERHSMAYNVSKFAALAPSASSMMNSKETLENILAASGSDKARPGRGKGHHAYTRYYAVLFKPLRYSRVRLVEIGVEEGRSMKAWQQYFSYADHIYGIGYGNFQKTPSQPCDSASATKTSGSSPCTLFRGDQSNVAFLESFLRETGGKFDIVIDDGSHLPSHQILTFETLWKSVRPGGLYVVEDIETNWWAPSSSVYGYSLRNQPNAVTKWKGVIDTVNREYTRGRSHLTDQRPDVYGNIESVEFGQNIIIFRKALEGDAAILARQPYRFAQLGGTR